MKLFKSIFNIKSKQNLSINFSKSVESIIQLIDNNKSNLTDDEFYQIICDNTSNNFEANEIYVFLPIVFAQLWLPTIKWHEEYDEILENNDIVSKKYNDTKSFKIILNVSKQYFGKNPSKETIINIGGRSAEINAVNKLLLEGGEIKDVKVHRTKIIR